MPKYIDYDAFREMEWALGWHKDNNDPQMRPIVKFLGYGGDYTVTSAIGEMFKDYTAIGILSGGSYSGHSIAFMMCPERYTYKTAFLGIHSSSVFTENKPYTKVDFQIEMETHDYLDKQVADLFARESKYNKHDAAYWMTIHTEARSSTKLLTGIELVQSYGLALDMDNFPVAEQWRIGRLKK